MSNSAQLRPVSVDTFRGDPLYPPIARAFEQILACGKVVAPVDVLISMNLLAHDLNLVPSITVYTRWSKGPKQRLRFTKNADPKLEEAYARHFVWPGKGAFHPPAPREKNVPALPR